MKSRLFARACLLAGVCLALASCLDSKSPLTPPENAKADADLFGLWRIENEPGAVEYYHVGLAGDKLPFGVLRIASTMRTKKGVVTRPGEMYMFPTVIGNNKFLNVAAIDAKFLDRFEKDGWQADHVDGYFVVKYQVKDNRLTIWHTDDDVKREWIKSGKIKGKIEDGAAYFTDTSENVTALLETADGEKLFAADPLVYQRVE